MAGRFSVEAVFKGIDKLSAPVRRMGRGVNRFTRSAERGLKKVSRAFTKLTATAKKGALAITAGLGAMSVAMGNIISTGADFGRAIGSAAAKFPDDIKRGTKEFKALERAARDVGSTTEFTSTQAAKGLGFLAKAGFDAEFSMNSLKDIVNFATASELDLATAADIASDAIGSFGLNVDDPQQRLTNLNRVMDVLALTANSTNTDVEQLFEAIKKGAPVATKAGQTIETFNAVAGTLASVGIKGSEAGTATKNIALALAGVGNQAGKTFKQLDIPLVDNAGKMRDVADIFEELSGKLAGVDEDKMLAIMNSIFGKISLASAANLLGDGADRIRKLRGELEAAGGSSQRTAEFIRNDVKGSIDSLNSAVEGVKISIFSMNEGPLKQSIDRMTEWVRVNEEFIAKNIGETLLFIIDNLGEIIKWVKRAVIAFTALFAFTTVVKALTAAFTLLNIIMSLNPLGLMVVGAFALIGAFTALVVWIDDVAAGFNRLPTLVKVLLAPITLLVNAIKFIKDNLDDIKGLGGAVVDVVSGDGSVMDAVKAAKKLITSPEPEPKIPSTKPIEMPIEFQLPGAVDVAALQAGVGPLKVPAEVKMLNQVPAPNVVKIPVEFKMPEAEPIKVPVELDVKTPTIPDATQKVTKVVEFPNQVAPEMSQENGQAAPQTEAQVITPGERIARQISEQNTVNRAELLIKGDATRAELVGETGENVAIKFEDTGSF